MKQYLKKYLAVPLVVAVFATAPAVFAQTPAEAGPETFAGSYTLWIAIVIGFAASFLCFRYAWQLKGSLTSGILNLFAAGMFVVVLGFLSVVLAWAPAPTQKIVHDLLFILGYSLMLAGASRIRKLSV